MNILRFPTSVPLEVALASLQGTLVQGRYGDRMMFNLTDGQVMYVPPIVANKIVEIIESNSWQLRHPIGPDAQPFLDWRASMNDEQWVNWAALDDNGWYERVSRDFGLDARPKNQKRSA